MTGPFGSVSYKCDSTPCQNRKLSSDLILQSSWMVESRGGKMFVSVGTGRSASVSVWECLIYALPLHLQRTPQCPKSTHTCNQSTSFLDDAKDPSECKKSHGVNVYNVKMYKKLQIPSKNRKTCLIYDYYFELILFTRFFHIHPTYEQPFLFSFSLRVRYYYSRPK